MKTALPLMLAFTLVACQPGTDVDSGTTNATADPAASTTTEPATGGPAAAIIALDAEGLRFVDEASGSTRLLPFGAPQAEALTAVGAVLGDASETGDLTECGAGPLHYAGFDQGLQLLFSDGTFSGWGSSGSLTTMDGLSADADRAEVEAAGVTEFTRDTLGNEFDHGGIYGVMDEGGDEVAVLAAGVNCFMR